MVQRRLVVGKAPKDVRHSDKKGHGIAPHCKHVRVSNGKLKKIILNKDFLLITLWGESMVRWLKSGI
jgi:hypothetical protein